MCAHVQECHCASVAVSEHVLSFHHVGSETELGFSGLVPLHTEASRQFKGFLLNKLGIHRDLLVHGLQPFIQLYTL